MSNTRVLIVEDEEPVLLGQGAVIGKLEGFEVAGLARNGLEALETVKKEDIDLVITDIRMPQYDGMWLLDRLEELNRPLTVIIVSAYDDKKYLLKAIKSPLVFDYLTKPYLDSEFLETLQSARSYLLHSRQQAGTFNSTLLINRIAGGQIREACELIKESIRNGKSELPELKNELYGLLVSLHMNPALSGYESEGAFNRTMGAIYQAESADQLSNVFNGYLNSLSIGKGSKEVTMLVAACLQVAESELSDSSLNLSAVADRLHVTANYLSSRFSRDMNQSFSSYLTQLRVARSMELLKSINYKVYEVAEMAGFTDVSYFNKIFKREVGITPLQYRMKEINRNAESDDPAGGYDNEES